MLYWINALGRLSNAQGENVTDNRLNINPLITWRPNARTRLTASATSMIDDMGSAVSYGPMVGMVTPSRFGRISRNLLTGDPTFDLRHTAYRAHPNLNGIQFDNNVEYNVATGPVEHTVVAGIDVQQQNFRNRTTTATSLDLYAPKYGTTLPASPTTSIDQEQKQLGLYL